MPDMRADPEKHPLPDRLLKATCCHRHAALYTDPEKDGAGVCCYCAPRRSIFRLPPGPRQRRYQERCDEALVATGVRLDGADQPKRWEGDDA